ncbi:MAG TPA: PVC-type heme-binding CxxCH protein, partial [Planctomycetia bacterium]|nr:PVC-type heme-binding CxxCH protein [Planctomycetia bacterium]
MLGFILTFSLASDALTPEESAKRLALPPGFRAELVAAEPNIESPVAIAFDERGRMYVAEYRDYPNGPPKGGAPLSRIRLLEDADGDGVFEKSVVFAEGLSFAQGVFCMDGGVLVTAAPVVWFLKDTDGDGKADVKRAVLEGFKEGNPQLRVSHPRMGPDNRIYLSNGLSGGEVRKAGSKDPPLKLGQNDICFDPKTGAIDLVAGFGQFGNTFDDSGRRYFCSNRNPVMTAFLPRKLLDANPYAPVFQGYGDIAPHGGDAKIYPRVATTTTAVSHLGTHTAACGVHVYRGGAWGAEHRNEVFVCEPTAHLVARSRLHYRDGNLMAERDPPGDEFLTSTDPWTRPVSLADGPDGNLYLVDMYRQVIEHPQYMPKGLPEKLPLRAGADRGRIYRIVKDAKSAGNQARFKSPEDSNDLVELIASENGWRRDLGRRLAIERQAKGLAPALRGILRRGGTEVKRNTLWTLDGLGELTADDVFALTGDRAALETALPLAARFPTDPRFEPLVAAGVSSPFNTVRIAAAIAATSLDVGMLTTLLVDALSLRK